LGVTDVPAAVLAATEAGCTVHTPASEVGDGITTALLRRSDGTIVGFIENPHFTLA
jgi:hypothetical protein